VKHFSVNQNHNKKQTTERRNWMENSSNLDWSIE
jgi:hypothetical protein